MFFYDFRGPRGNILHHLWSRGRLFRRPKIVSICSLMFEAKCEKNSSFGLRLELGASVSYLFSITFSASENNQPLASSSQGL